MSVAGVALVAALGALVVAVGVAYASRLGRRRAHEQVTEALTTLGDRMDLLARDLGAALARVHREGSRAQALVDLGHALDLDDVLSRAVEAVAAVPGVDAALIRVETGEGTASVASLGLPPDLAEAQLVSGPPDGRGVRAVRLAYLYGTGDEPPGALRSGLAAPIEHDGEILGFLAAYSFDSDLAAADAVPPLEAVARAAGPAVDSALRHRDVPAIHSGVDLLTGLRSRRMFHDALAREVGVAHRLGRPLALLLLDLDGLRALNTALGQVAGDRALAATAAGILAAARDGDVACRIGGDEFGVVLPDATPLDAEAMLARVRTAVVAQATEATRPATLSAGIASLRPDDDALTLFQRAEDALRRAKRAGRGTAA